MSSVDVATIKSKNTYPPVISNSSNVEIGRFARAFISFNGVTGTVNSSFGTSGFTKNGTGDYTISFAASYFPDAYYTATWAYTNEVNVQHTNAYIESKSATAFRIRFFNSANSANTADKSIVDLTFFR